MHPVPALPHTVTFGETRTVAVNTPMVSYQGGSYSVPHRLLGETVWVRVHGAGRDERVVIVHVGDRGAIGGGPACGLNQSAAGRPSSSISR